LAWEKRRRGIVGYISSNLFLHVEIDINIISSAISGAIVYAMYEKIIWEKLVFCFKQFTPMESTALFQPSYFHSVVSFLSMWLAFHKFFVENGKQVVYLFKKIIMWVPVPT